MVSWQLILFVSISPLLHSYAQVVTCNGGDCSCPMSSSTGETCTLNCGKEDICKERTLTCRPGDACIIICDAKSSCAAGARIDAYDATDVTIFCNAEDACKDDFDINCGKEDCMLQCNQKTSCESPGNIVTTFSRSFACIGSCPSGVPVSFSPAPTRAPTTKPTRDPTRAPTTDPSPVPTPAPSLNPSMAPTAAPSLSPTIAPSYAPTVAPTYSPSLAPTHNPSIAPTLAPSNIPSSSPTIAPSYAPTVAPTYSPSLAPTHNPSIAPTLAPSNIPSSSPTIAPSYAPTVAPTYSPSLAPTHNPSIAPTLAPSNIPSSSPTLTPTLSPSVTPTYSPSLSPTHTPTLTPTSAPSFIPTSAPTNTPTVPSATPTFDPTLEPTYIPTGNPTVNPTIDPTMDPTRPTGDPTINPTYNPTSDPTLDPTLDPTIVPTITPTAPTLYPTQDPTSYPTHGTINYIINTTTIPQNINTFIRNDNETHIQDPELTRLAILIGILTVIFCCASLILMILIYSKQQKIKQLDAIEIQRKYNQPLPLPQLQIANTKSQSKSQTQTQTQSNDRFVYLSPFASSESVMSPDYSRILDGIKENQESSIDSNRESPDGKFNETMRNAFDQLMMQQSPSSVISGQRTGYNVMYPHIFAAVKSNNTHSLTRSYSPSGYNAHVTDGNNVQSCVVYVPVVPSPSTSNVSNLKDIQHVLEKDLRVQTCVVGVNDNELSNASSASELTSCSLSNTLAMDIETNANTEDFNTDDFSNFNFSPMAKIWNDGMSPVVSNKNKNEFIQ